MTSFQSWVKVILMKKITNKKLTKKYTDGRKYVGEFKDGKRHGQGTFTLADGSKEVGKFKDGNFVK